MDMRQKIFFLINIYLSQNDKNPTDVYLTHIEENELILLPECDISKGPRASFQQLCNLTIHWDSKRFEVK